MTGHLMLLGLMTGTFQTPTAQAPGADAAVPDPASCRPCHTGIYDSYLQTAHYTTSAEANARTIKGDFSEGHNLLRTMSEGLYFRMEQRQNGFYQVAYLGGVEAQAERFDVVMGSARKGQSYLYWRNGRLYQLPVSYFPGLQAWGNSPGYRDGEVDFQRMIQPRCLECHTTSFGREMVRGRAQYSRVYQLGLSCSKCHGDGRRHVEHHTSRRADTQGQYIFNPARASRSLRLDTCGFCHSGGRQPRKPPFSYRPGQPLDAYFLPHPAEGVTVPDVHGNQIGLLERTRCFAGSPEMSCSTCHDVHQTQRDVTRMAQRCLGCHKVSGHGMASRIGRRMVSACVDCHMPNQQSTQLVINAPKSQSGLDYRSHAIGIYPERTERVLRSVRP